MDSKCRELKKEISAIDVQINTLKKQRKDLIAELEQVQASYFAERIQNPVTAKYQEYFDWEDKINKTLKYSFGLQELRPMQRIAINATLDGADVIVVMPTGAGKSLIYQLPAFVSAQEGFTLVISPLVSLMTDQIRSLKKVRNLPPQAVRFMDAGTPRQEQQEILDQMAPSKRFPLGTSTLKLLFVTPEKLVKSKRLKNKLDVAFENKRLMRIAIDEIHCISQWGHDFRPDYKALHILRRQYPGVPILGLTATASVSVVLDIQRTLALNPENCLVLRSGCNRPNLKYRIVFSKFSTRELASKLEIGNLIKDQYSKQTGIVYAYSQKDAEDLAAYLNSVKIRSAPYHAALDLKDRSLAHKKWCENEIHVIVATCAFGMGIDKADVRFVLHYSASRSMETYYQESGRAGRDGQPADCVLFWRFSDFFRLASLVYAEQPNSITKLMNMTQYCLDLKTCRRKLIANSLDDNHWTAHSDSCSDFNICDNCSRESSSFSTFDFGDLLRQVEQVIDEKSANGKQRLTGLKLVEFLTKNSICCDLACPQESHARSSKRQKTDDLSLTFQHVTLSAIIHNKLKLEFHFTPYSTVTYVVPNRPDDYSLFVDLVNNC